MSFTDDTRRFGMLTMVVATMVIVTGVALFFDSDLKSHWNIIGGIGHIIAGTIILGTGYLIHSGVVPRFTYRFFPDGLDTKSSVLTGYTASLGFASILGLGTSMAGIVICAVTGLVLLVVVRILTNDRRGTVGRSLWITLHVACFLGIVGCLLAVFSESQIAIIAGICGCLMYLLTDMFLFDPDVKARFGM